MNAIDLDVGDHVTTTGLDVQVIAHRRVTPDSKSGTSFRLLPSGVTLDSSEVQPLAGFSHREYERDNAEESSW